MVETIKIALVDVQVAQTISVAITEIKTFSKLQ